MTTELTNYIPLSRKSFENFLWTEKRELSRFEAWLDLLQSARFEEAETGRMIGGSFVKWKRGELPASLRFLAERWGWSKNKVDCFLKVLVSEQMIVKRTAVGTPQTVITICKYESYNVKSKTKGQQKDMEGTAKGHGGDKTNKDNKGKNNTNSIELRKKEFSASLKPFLETYGKDTLNEFYTYWTEANKSGTKFRKELERTWDTSGRLRTWAKRETAFVKANPKKTAVVDQSNNQNLFQ